MLNGVRVSSSPRLQSGWSCLQERQCTSSGAALGAAVMLGQSVVAAAAARADGLPLLWRLLVALAEHS